MGLPALVATKELSSCMIMANFTIKNRLSIMDKKIQSLNADVEDQLYRVPYYCTRALF